MSFFKQLNRDLLNESFHVCASTLQSSGVSLKFKPRVSNIYPHSKQSHMIGGMKYETVSDVLTRSCNNGDVISCGVLGK